MCVLQIYIFQKYNLIIPQIQILNAAQSSEKNFTWIQGFIETSFCLYRF